jgi:hypothetical protein
VEYLVQVVDTSGNVAVSSNKATLYVVDPGTPPTGRLKVAPTVCLKKERNKTVTYRFGYDNPNPFVVKIERGNDNRLIGANKKLRRKFKPGVDRQAFKVTVLKGNSVTWVLDGLQATGTMTIAKCSDYTRTISNSTPAQDEQEENETESPPESD